MSHACFLADAAEGASNDGDEGDELHDRERASTLEAERADSNIHQLLKSTKAELTMIFERSTASDWPHTAREERRDPHLDKVEP